MSWIQVEGRSVVFDLAIKEGGVLQRFYDSPAEFHQTLEADRAVWNSSLLKRAPPNMRLRQKKLSLDLIWCEKYSL